MISFLMILQVPSRIMMLGSLGRYTNVEEVISMYAFYVSYEILEPTLGHADETY